MKKLTIIAAAVVTLLAACTKEVVFTTDPQAITFQMANYVPQTRAINQDTIAFAPNGFVVSAWYHDDANSGSQAFMQLDSVIFNTDKWTTKDRTYFWPKTGFINFFAYTGLPGASNVAEGTVKYGDSAGPVYTTDILKNHDPMLAEGAYRYSSVNYNNDSWDFTYSGQNVTGVPMLFHHLLAKVSFVVEFDASSVSDNKNKWELTINNASFNYADQGYLVVNYTDPTVTGLAWPYRDSTATPQWTAKTGDNVTLSAPDSGVETAAGGIGSANKLTAIVGTADSKSAKDTIFREISVLPQTFATTNPYFAICYTLTHYYNNVEQTTETVNLTGSTYIDASSNNFPALGSIPVADFMRDVTDPASVFTSWIMNHKYVYTVTIKPNHEITFSPAVINWEPDVTAGYIYPTDL